MNLAIIICLGVLLFFNITILIVVLRTWFSQKRSQQIKYWYDKEGKLQFELDPNR